MSANMSVLIIDDENMVGMILKDYLEDEGFTVEIYENGTSGLEAINKSKFDAAIVDLRLPDMEGDTFILQSHELRPEMKFFIHTGSLDYSLSEDLKKIGMNEKSILYKPVSDMSVIREALEKSINE